MRDVRGAPETQMMKSERYERCKRGSKNPNDEKREI